MTIPQFLALFGQVKTTKKGWTVCCPAHEDTHPSLGIAEGQDGRILLKCLAACANEDILRALGLEWPDLFPATPLDGRPRPVRLPPVRPSPEKLAFAFELHAHDLTAQAENILRVAAPCEDCDTWTDADRDLAMRAVSRAYAYQERAIFCQQYADHLRERAYVA